jgi:hypothetical protein
MVGSQCNNGEAIHAHVVIVEGPAGVAWRRARSSLKAVYVWSTLSARVSAMLITGRSYSSKGTESSPFRKVGKVDDVYHAIGFI